MSVLVVIQARLGSTRLPGKVMERIGDRTMLEHVAARAIKAVGRDRVVLTSPEYDYAIRDLVGDTTHNGFGLLWEPHDPPDVLSGFIRIALNGYVDHIVRLTADCPLLAVDVLEQVIQASLAYAYVGSTRPALWACDGWDVERVRAADLFQVAQWATDEDREHVTPPLYGPNARDVRRGGQCVICRAWISNWEPRSHFEECPVPGLKLSVDTAEDLERVRAIYAAAQGDPLLTSGAIVAAARRAGVIG